MYLEHCHVSSEKIDVNRCITCLCMPYFRNIQKQTQNLYWGRKKRTNNRLFRALEAHRYFRKMFVMAEIWEMQKDKLTISPFFCDFWNISCSHSHCPIMSFVSLSSGLCLSLPPNIRFVFRATIRSLLCDCSIV